MKNVLVNRFQEWIRMNFQMFHYYISLFLFVSFFSELTSHTSKADLPSIYDEDKVIGLRLDNHPDHVAQKVKDIAEKHKWMDQEALQMVFWGQTYDVCPYD